MRALLLPADPDETPHLIDVDADWRKLAEALGHGAQYIERVRTPFRNTALVVDEEGLYHDGPWNPWTYVFYPGVIKGSAILVGEDNSDFCDLPADVWNDEEVAG